MNFIKDITWNTVFEGWRARESHNPGWIHCATVIKGWPDWESWRAFTASQIRASDRQWELYEFADPMNEISAMLVGPYSGWQSRMKEKNTGSFEDLLNIPEQLEVFSRQEGILGIMKGLPFSTELIGIIRDDKGKIVCIDGHHRAIAITLARRQGTLIDFAVSRVKIALTHLPIDECFLLDEMLKRGSSKIKKAP